MRHAHRKFVLSLAALGLAVVLAWASLSGSLGAEDGRAAAVGGIGGLMLALVAGYLAVTSGIAARGAARLQAGAGVIARWRVPPETWRAFRAIRAEHTGVSAPMLRGLLFAPRELGAGESPEIVCGERGVLIDGCYFALAPGRGAGLEQAGLVPTEPPCVGLLVGMMAGAHESPMTRRWLLLLPIAPGAQREADAAIRHYAAAVARVRDLAEFARDRPAAARRRFWTLLLGSVAAVAAAVALEINGLGGALPPLLGIAGFLTALVTLILGLKVRLARAR